MRVAKPSVLYDTVEEVTGRHDANGEVIEPLDIEEINSSLKRLRERGLTSLAVILMHGYAFPEFEIEK